MNVEIRKLNKDDIQIFSELIKLFGDIFQMKELTIPDHKYLANLLNSNSFLTFTAIINNKVIGGLTAYILSQYYFNKSIVYIYDFAIAEQYQRKGIGRKLMSEVKKYCQENDHIELFVQADKSDEHAIKFYRSTIPTSELDALQFNYIVNK